MEAQKRTLQETIEVFSDIEKRIEKSLASGQVPPNPAKLNDVVSARIDELHSALASLRRGVGEP